MVPNAISVRTEFTYSFWATPGKLVNDQSLIIQSPLSNSDRKTGQSQETGTTIIDLKKGVLAL